MTDPTYILGIESSCDDTAAAILSSHSNGKVEILANVVYGQNDLHADFGGVVPEIAARAHAEKIDLAIIEALNESSLSLNDINAIAVTAGPGLIGGVMSGVMCAKGIAATRNIPLYGVNHLAGHALTPRLTDQIQFPYLMLLVSGGHCQFLAVKSPTSFERIGGTIDDAPGEAFDKVARCLGLPQPGGPSVEKCAVNGDPKRFALPHPMIDRDDCNLSFSGLKTAVLRTIESLEREQGGLTKQDQSDIAASFQSTVADVLAIKSARALTAETFAVERPTAFCVAGGVAANKKINESLQTLSTKSEIPFVAPPLSLCTDNAAMIAFAALDSMHTRDPDDLSLAGRPRWPLDTTKAGLSGGGKKGAKS